MRLHIDSSMRYVMRLRDDSAVYFVRRLGLLLFSISGVNFYSCAASEQKLNIPVGTLQKSTKSDAEKKADLVEVRLSMMLSVS